MNLNCLICGLKNPENAHFWKMHHIKQAQYYEQYFPRLDLSTNEKIPYKNSEQYFSQCFLNKTNLKKYLQEKPQAKIVGKSKKLDKFYKILNEAKESIKTNNIAKAKKLYIEARDLYVGLEYEEKKEAYKELMELYNKLLR